MGLYLLKEKKKKHKKDMRSTSNVLLKKKSLNKNTFQIHQTLQVTF